MPCLVVVIALSGLVVRLTSIPVMDRVLWTGGDFARAAPADAFHTEAVAAALTMLGAEYHYGSDGTGCPAGQHDVCADCSGLVVLAYAAVGVKLPHSTAALAEVGQPVLLTDLQPGDILLFRADGKAQEPLDHCGLYVGNGLFLHAGSRGVRLDDLDEGYWGRREPARLRGARRVLALPRR
ncbi:MAG: C40 family peptidase [Armatimonadota bacterium]|nr:C40 family peptidase [Armatimonadota bacterium]